MWFDAGLGEKWIVLDHHRIPDSEHDHQRVINAWRYGIDGGMEICAGGMAYLAAVALDRNNADLAPMAVVAALGDRQDQGDKRSLVGKNLEISDAAKSRSSGNSGCRPFCSSMVPTVLPVMGSTMGIACWSRSFSPTWLGVSPSLAYLTTSSSTFFGV